jgi:heme oxygenase
VADAAHSAAAHLQLRERTARAHAAAEATPVMARLLAGQLDEPGYLALLAGYRAIYAQFETEHEPWLASLVASGWLYRRRLALLDADLGQNPERPVAARPAAVESATVWGMLYVIEGSALGGQVLLRRLRNRFPQRDHAFFACQPHDGYPWRRFQAALDASLRSAADIERAVHGADDMFNRFNTMLEGLCP